MKVILHVLQLVCLEILFLSFNVFNAGINLDFGHLRNLKCLKLVNIGIEKYCQKLVLPESLVILEIINPSRKSVCATSIIKNIRNQNLRKLKINASFVILENEFFRGLENVIELDSINSNE